MNRWTDEGGAWQSLGTVPDVDFVNDMQLVMDGANRPFIFLNRVTAAASATSCKSNFAVGVVKYYDGGAWHSGGPPAECKSDLSFFASAAIDPTTGAAVLALGSIYDESLDGDYNYYIGGYAYAAPPPSSPPPMPSPPSPQPLPPKPKAETP